MIHTDIDCNNFIFFPANPLLPHPSFDLVIPELIKHGLICETHSGQADQGNILELNYTPGSGYFDFMNVPDDPKINLEALQKDSFMFFTEHEKIELIGSNGVDEKNFFSPETGFDLGETWSDELDYFLADNHHQWIDPINKKRYYFFELIYPHKFHHIAYGRHHITLIGPGEPNEKLMELLENITGQRYKCMGYPVL